MRVQIRNTRQQQQSGVSTEIKSINQQFRFQLRQKHKQAIFQSIRKQYNNYHSETNGKNGQKIQQEINSGLDPQQNVISSRMLQKYSSISHKDIWKCLPQISQHLLDNNLYLSVFQQQSLEQICQGDIGQTDEQSLLVHDLFYLTLQFQGSFHFPRKFKFIRNKSCLVASFVSMVSTIIMPEQLAYWLQYMNEQDKQIVYLGVIGPDENETNSHLHYQSWVNHPLLRHTLLEDIKMQSAAKAIREIVGFKNAHPDRLKNSQGVSLYQILCAILHQQLEGMRQSSKDSKEIRCEHLQVCVKIIEARLLTEQDALQLKILLSKVVSKKVQSQTQLISPLFCIWVIDALLNHSIQVLSAIGYQIIMSVIQYDPNKFIYRGNMQIQSIFKVDFEKFELFKKKVSYLAPCLNLNNDEEEKDSDQFDQ